MNPNDVNGTDAVDRAFRNVLTVVEAKAVAPMAGEIAARGRRRRARHMVAGGVATAVLILGGCSILPWAAKTPEPLGSPGVTSPSVTRAAPTGIRKVTSDKIPTGFLLHENDGGERRDGPDPALEERCYGKPSTVSSLLRRIGELAARVDFYHQLVLYPDEAAARDAMDRLRQQGLHSCIGYAHASTLKKAESLPWGDEAVTMTVAKPADGAGEHTGAPLRIIMLRVGASVAVFWGYPEIPQMEQDALALIPRLCLYDADCRPAAGLPAPMSTLTDGGNAWVAVLEVFADADANAKPGGAMAAAASIGYRPSTVPLECDEGAAQALGRGVNGVSYVVVYFDDRQSAQAFAAALPSLDVRTVEVRTRCVR